MASSSPYDSFNSHNTTFVQADPSNFRTIVQKLTGAPYDPSTQKLPLNHSTRDLAPKRPAFKLHERRQSAAKNLEIQLDNVNETTTTRPQPNLGFYKQQLGSSFLVSPVSPLDFVAARASPQSPNEIEQEEEEEEQRVIAERGFYLHPSPLTTPRSGEPELLTLFPLHSPRDNVVVADHDDDDDDDCSSSRS